MPKKITAKAREELVGALRDRYQRATRSEKALILNEFVAVSGYHRKHAVRVLSGAERHSEPGARSSRPRLYDEAVRQALTTLWEASDSVFGKPLKLLLPTLVAALERHGHLTLDSAVRERVLTASAATIDRLLGVARASTQAGMRRRPKPAVRQRIPVRTFGDWKDPLPGNMEIDLVAHCGETVAGSFVHTLVLTDVATG